MNDLIHTGIEAGQDIQIDLLTPRRPPEGQQHRLSKILSPRGIHLPRSFLNSNLHLQLPDIHSLEDLSLTLMITGDALQPAVKAFNTLPVTSHPKPGIHPT